MYVATSLFKIFYLILSGVLELQGRFTYEKIQLDRNQIFEKKMHFAVYVI